MSIIPNICSAISSVTLTRTRFNKTINQTLTRRGRPFGAEFGWLGSGAGAAHAGTPEDNSAPAGGGGRVSIPGSPGARQRRGLFPAGPRPGPRPKFLEGCRPPPGARQSKPARGRAGWVPGVCPRRSPCPTRARSRPPRVGPRAPPLAAKALTAPAPHSKRKISL